jgi:predicted regulator of Ras-like GTPase activity (Roadblock/LC7/MglB family)
MKQNIHNIITNKKTIQVKKLDNSLNKFPQRKYSGMENSTIQNVEETQKDVPYFDDFLENTWKEVPGIQGLFIVNSFGETICSKTSEYFDNGNQEQVSKILSSASYPFALTALENKFEMSINVYEQYTVMTSKMEDLFMVMFVPNSTNVGHSIGFTDSLSSMK